MAIYYDSPVETCSCTSLICTASCHMPKITAKTSSGFGQVPAPTPASTPNPTEVPTTNPTQVPTEVPTTNPTQVPTTNPTQAPTEAPTWVPTEIPTEVPTRVPTEIPTEVPTQVPTEVPTTNPTQAPTEIPTEVPTTNPTQVPTEVPTTNPTRAPTELPTQVPTTNPTQVPTQAPTELPTEVPTTNPTQVPTPIPTLTSTPTPIPCNPQANTKLTSASIILTNSNYTNEATITDVKYYSSNSTSAFVIGTTIEKVFVVWDPFSYAYLNLAQVGTNINGIAMYCNSSTDIIRGFGYSIALIKNGTDSLLAIGAHNSTINGVPYVGAVFILKGWENLTGVVDICSQPSPLALWNITNSGAPSYSMLGLILEDGELANGDGALAITEGAFSSHTKSVYLFTSFTFGSSVDLSSYTNVHVANIVNVPSTYGVTSVAIRVMNNASYVLVGCPSYSLSASVEGVVFVWAIQQNPTIDSLSSSSQHIFYENSTGSLFGFSLDSSNIHNQSHILIGAPGVNSYTGSACDFVFNTPAIDVNLNNSAFNVQCVGGYSTYGFFGGNVKFGKVKLPTGERYDVAIIASPLANAASGQVDIVIHDSLAASPFALSTSFATEHSQTKYNDTGAMMGGILAFVADDYMLIAGQNSKTAVVTNITCMDG